MVNSPTWTWRREADGSHGQVEPSPVGPAIPIRCALVHCATVGVDSTGSVKNHSHRADWAVSRLLQLATVASWIILFQRAEPVVSSIDCRDSPSQMNAHIDYSTPVDDGFSVIGDEPRWILVRASIDVLDDLGRRSRGERPVAAMVAEPSPRGVSRVSQMVGTALQCAPEILGDGYRTVRPVTRRFATAPEIAKATTPPRYALFSSLMRIASGTY